MEKKKYPAVNIGSASMLVIFIILCLVTFSLLSVTSSNNDKTYAENIARRTLDYYTASNEAEAQLAQLDKLLAKAYELHGNTYLEQGAAVFDAEAMENLAYPVDISFFPVLSFHVPMNDTQALAVSLQLQLPTNNEGKLYKVTSWKEISTDSWDNDEPLNVM